jgi:hypothetical protein
MIKFKKIYFKNEYVFILLGVLILTASLFGYLKWMAMQEEKEDAIDIFEEQLPAQCENGVWIEFPTLDNMSQYIKFSGKEKLKYDEEKGIFLGEIGYKIFSTDKQTSLFFFVEREVQIEGHQLENNEIHVDKLKCVGVEANKDILKARRNLMHYIKNNINDLAPEKSVQGDWQVGTFYFVTDTDAYVQYETAVSFMEEAPYDSHLWLIRATNIGTTMPTIETLAYIAEDIEGFDKNVVKQGVDLYKESKNMIIYEFDDATNQWILQ